MSSSAPQDLNIAILAGGKSAEREVSLDTGAGVKAALEEAGYATAYFDPAEDDWIARLIKAPVDVAFICLHGRYGEDGTVQGLLELLEIPYTGSGVMASSLAMDKHRSKLLFKASDIPTPPALYVRRGEQVDPAEIARTIGHDVVVKPCCEGSAVGVKIIRSLEGLDQALQEVHDLDDTAIIEKLITGTEVTVSVLGNDDPRVLPLIEIVTNNEFYDYDAKYSQGGSEHIIPARIDDASAQACEEYSVSAHKVLGCAGLSRSDFMIDEEGNAWLLETNTIPGMTTTSLFPDSASAAGISYQELCVQMVEYAQNR